MASLIIISWRDIPSQVIVKRGRETGKVPLSARFQEAIKLKYNKIYNSKLIKFNKNIDKFDQICPF